MRRWLSLALLAAFFCVSCATNFRLPHPQEEAIPEGKARLYVFVDHWTNQYIPRVSFSVDGRELVDLSNGQFFSVDIDPGQRLFGMRSRSLLFVGQEETTSITLAPGVTFYLALQIGRGTFQWMDFRAAYRELAGMRRVEGDRR